MATIKEVAQAAQVSTAAVSRVLNKDDNISVSPEVRARIFQAAHVLGYVSPRQRKAAEHKTHLVIGVADWRIIRPDRHNVRLSSLSCLVQMMTDQYEVTFVRLTFGEPQKVDGIIALGVFSEKEIDFLRSLSFAIVFVNSNQHNYEFDQVQVDFDRGQEQMVSYLLDQKQYTGLGYIGGIYDGANGRIGTHRLAAIRRILEERGQYDPRTFHVGEIRRERGYALAKKAVEDHTLAEAVLLGSDEVAEGALEAFRDLRPCAERCGGHHLSGYSDLGEQVAHRHLPGDVSGLCVGKRPGTAFWPDQSASFPGSDRHGAHPPEDWRHSLNH